MWLENNTESLSTPGRRGHETAWVQYDDAEFAQAIAAGRRAAMGVDDRPFDPEQPDVASAVSGQRLLQRWSPT